MFLLACRRDDLELLLYIFSRIVPDFMTSGGLPVKLKSKGFQFFNNLLVFKTGEPAYQLLTIRA
jgi:hypothetical protein